MSDWLIASLAAGTWIITGVTWLEMRRRDRVAQGWERTYGRMYALYREASERATHAEQGLDLLWAWANQAEKDNK